MGGNAFDNTKRLSEAEYQALCEKLALIFEQLQVRYRIPPEVKDKAWIAKEYKGSDEPYGDLDLIVAVEANEDRQQVMDQVMRTLDSPEPSKKNHNTQSLITNSRHQVDLLFCHPDELDFLAAVKGNNDFLAFFGHLLTPYRLKLSEKGLFLVLRSDNGAQKAEILLSKGLSEVSSFFDLPPQAFDGVTRLSTCEVFEALVKTNVYCHRKEYDEKYEKRENKKGRAMIQRMFELLQEYDGRFEEQKEDTERRKVFKEFKSKSEPSQEDRRVLEDHILRHFNKTQQGEEARIKFRAKQQRNFTFAKMLSMFPNRLNHKTGIEVIKYLRTQKPGDGGLEVYMEALTDEAMEKVVEDALTALKL